MCRQQQFTFEKASSSAWASGLRVRLLLMCCPYDASMEVLRESGPLAVLSLVVELGGSVGGKSDAASAGRLCSRACCSRARAAWAIRACRGSIGGADSRGSGDSEGMTE
jgi:hypothetical protein